MKQLTFEMGDTIYARLIEASKPQKDITNTIWREKIRNPDYDPKVKDSLPDIDNPDVTGEEHMKKVCLNKGIYDLLKRVEIEQAISQASSDKDAEISGLNITVL